MGYPQPLEERQERDRGDSGMTEENRDEGAQEGDGAESENVPLADLREDISVGSDGEDADEEEGSETDSGKGGSDAAGRSQSTTDRSEIQADRSESPSPDIDAPLSELRSGIEDRRSGETEGMSLFHREGVGSVESESVWAELLMDTGDAMGLLDPTAVESEGGRTYQVVPTALCHRCEYFGDPPTLHCTHEGTTIHETVDMDHYRVSECPMVEEAPQDGNGEE